MSVEWNREHADGAKANTADKRSELYQPVPRVMACLGLNDIGPVGEYQMRVRSDVIAAAAGDYEIIASGSYHVDDGID
jgi:hypothetical protein